MSVPIVICDDSNMARKHMARCLPGSWDVDITFATNGEEAISALHKGLGEVLFLDLTMPVMDGFETLKVIRDQDLHTMVIVVSGDIQAEAQQRVISMGAMDFVRKPAKPEVLMDILDRYGIHRAAKTESPKLREVPAIVRTDEALRFDSYQEITNVAVGKAADLLARLTGEFITIPVPKVALLELGELEMALYFSQDDRVSAVCQGFIAPGIAGEALLIFSDPDLGAMAEILNHETNSEIEVLADLSGVLLGTVLNGLGEQLNLTFSLSCPSVLDIHIHTSELIRKGVNTWKKTLAIEVTFEIPSRSIICDVLLLFTEGSQENIDKRLVWK